MDEEEIIIRSSDELLADPVWMAEYEKRRKIVEAEEIKEQRARMIDRRITVKNEVMRRKFREKMEAANKKELFDKMYNTPFSEKYKQIRLNEELRDFDEVRKEVEEEEEKNEARDEGPELDGLSSSD